MWNFLFRQNLSFGRIVGQILVIHMDFTWILLGYDLNVCKSKKKKYNFKIEFEF
jgi:hypothetical protein